MANPSNRVSLAEYCFRRLGAPVLEINVDPDQVEDCIDDAIQLFQEFHSDASYRTFLSHQITEDDVTNGYIPVSNDVHFIVQLLPYNTSSIGGGSGWMSAKYQIAASDLHNSGTYMGSMSYYEQLGQYMNLIDMVLTGVPITEYQRHGNKLHIYGEWWDKELQVGDYVVIEAYVTIDPNTTTSIYNNIFIKNYTTALIKHRWGQNMSKFEGMQLPGGVVISGERILSEAQSEIEQLEEKMRNEYEVPPSFFVG